MEGWHPNPYSVSGTGNNMFEYLKRLILSKSSPRPIREVMLYTGDGVAGPEFVGMAVNVNGRKGKVVEATMLTLTVEWEQQ